MNVRTPTAPAAPNPETVREERVLYERSLFGVLAGILGNCAAGMGAAFVAGVIAHALGVSGATLTRATVYAWLTVWGLLMIAWFGADEYSVVRLRYQRQQALDHLDAAEDEIATLEAENDTLRSENAVLTWRVQEAEKNRNYITPTAPESQSYQDARTLIKQWGETGQHPGRRKVNMSEARHTAAIEVLQSRGIVHVPAGGRTVSWLAPDAPAALALLTANTLMIGDRHAPQMDDQSER